MQSTVFGLAVQFLELYKSHAMQIPPADLPSDGGLRIADLDQVGWETKL